MHRLLVGIMILSAACGSDDSNGQANRMVDASMSLGRPDSMPVEFATLSGQVWVPGNALGAVPAGHEIPVYNAVVYVTKERPAPFEEGAACQACTEAPVRSAQSDHRGNFTLSNVFPGDYWLVIEKGAFRLEQEISVAPNASVMLTAEQTTLPNKDDPAAGMSIPRIALATGQFDDMEAILGKMGIGSVDSAGKFEGASAAGAFDIYDNGGDTKEFAVGTMADLVNDLDKMLTYDIIFVPCAGSSYSDELNKQQVLKNIRDYVAAGGKMYVTDWAGEWVDNVFPAQVQLGDLFDTPANAYDEASDSWNPSLFGSANGSPSYTSDHAEAVNDDLRMWLEGQKGPTAGGGEASINPLDISIEGNWNRIDGLHAVTVGTNDQGNPIIDSPQKYVMGPTTSGGPNRPLTVTYEPAGCGRVLYSTYHTTHNTHVGLAPQERMLVYLIMEIGVCNNEGGID